jgi:hypothetical protein
MGFFMGSTLLARSGILYFSQSSSHFELVKDNPLSPETTNHAKS